MSLIARERAALDPLQPFVLESANGQDLNNRPAWLFVWSGRSDVKVDKLAPETFQMRHFGLPAIRGLGPLPKNRRSDVS